MFAALAYFTIEENQAPAAARVFADRILPDVRRLPGFAGGYWLDPEDGKGFGFMLFDSEEHARQVQPPHFDWSAPGVETIRLEVRRVAVAVP